jgi:protein-disulfide isomerase
LVEFGDYQCPYCQQIHPEVNKILAHYGDKVSFAFHDFPLQMHAQAQKAAEAARCAGAQGKYWNFHDALFENGKKLDVPQLKDQAQKLSLDAAKFDKCLDSGEQAGAVAKDAAEARRLGLSGTPTFFINGHLFPGPLKYDALRDTIDKELASNTTSQAANKNF